MNHYLDRILRTQLRWNLGNFLPYLAGGINIIYNLLINDKKYANLFAINEKILDN
ncbi:hypothetical protein [Bartonella sp. DGB1]|uniref:hypothetical protein n=1 Tax=Bartonella sp. DGB1 TaxID=3239807 RepID=UPI00352647AA